MNDFTSKLLKLANITVVNTRFEFSDEVEYFGDAIREEDVKKGKDDGVDGGRSVIKDNELPKEQSAEAVVIVKLSNKKLKKKEYSKRRKERSKSVGDIGNATITFGSVEEIYFKRHIGYDAVPTSGCYPLGFSMHADDTCPRTIVSVDEHVSRKQAELLLKAQSLPIAQRALISMTSKCDKEDAVLQLETRQFDYKSKVKNPLFEANDEVSRINLLGFNDGKATVAPEDSANIVRELNNEVIAIRSSRSHNGCTCKPLKIDKLSVAKMKSEILSHCNGSISKDDIEKLSKAELTTKLRDVINLCTLCVSNNCECVQLGVQCNDQTCVCLAKGYNAGRSHCDNPNGKYIFSADLVNEYRRKFSTQNAKEVH